MLRSAVNNNFSSLLVWLEKGIEQKVSEYEVDALTSAVEVGGCSRIPP